MSRVRGGTVSGKKADRIISPHEIYVGGGYRTDVQAAVGLWVDRPFKDDMAGIPGVATDDETRKALGKIVDKLLGKSVFDLLAQQVEEIRNSINFQSKKDVINNEWKNISIPTDSDHEKITKKISEISQRVDKQIKDDVNLCRGLTIAISTAFKTIIPEGERSDDSKPIPANRLNGVIILVNKLLNPEIPLENTELQNFLNYQQQQNRQETQILISKLRKLVDDARPSVVKADEKQGEEDVLTFAKEEKEMWTDYEKEILELKEESLGKNLSKIWSLRQGDKIKNSHYDPGLQKLILDTDHSNYVKLCQLISETLKTCLTYKESTSPGINKKVTLLEHQVTAIAKRFFTQPSFSFSYINPTHDLLLGALKAIKDTKSHRITMYQPDTEKNDHDKKFLEGINNILEKFTPEHMQRSSSRPATPAPSSQRPTTPIPPRK